MRDPEYIYYRELFDIFKAFTTPKLKRTLEDQGIRYMMDSKGKPFCLRSSINGHLTGVPEKPSEASE